MTVAVIVERSGEVTVLTGSAPEATALEQALLLEYEDVHLTEDDDLIPLSGLSHVWCTTPTVDDEFSLINVVEIGDENQKLITIFTIFDGGTYAHQRQSTMFMELLQPIDELVDWEKIDPAPAVRSFRLQSTAVPSEGVKVFRGEIGERSATIVVVSTAR